MYIAVTGRGGSGKSTICKYIVNKYDNFEYVNVDKIIEEQILKSDDLTIKVNNIYKNKIYSIEDIIKSYFSFEENDKKIHEEFVKEVDIAIRKYISNSNSKNFVIDWFLLHKTSIFLESDIKILIELDYDERIRRVASRNKTKDIDFFKLVDKYYDDNYTCNFDIIINNYGNTYKKTEFLKGRSL